jgi:hypothetical protein
MKDAYNKAIFAYLNTAENYKSALEIEQFLPEFRKEALIRFWDAVKRKLEKKVVETRWTLHADYLVNGNFGQDCSIGISLDNIIGLGVYYQELDALLYLGTYLENRPELNNNLNLDKARIYIQDSKDEFNGYDFSHPWWLAYRNTKLDFQNNLNYGNIIGNEFDKTVEQIVNDLWVLAEKMEEHIRFIDEEYRD